MSTPHGFSHNAGPKLVVNEFLDKVILNFFDWVVPLSEDLARSVKFNKNVKVITGIPGPTLDYNY